MPLMPLAVPADLFGEGSSADSEGERLSALCCDSSFCDLDCFMLGSLELVSSARALRDEVEGREDAEAEDVALCWKEEKEACDAKGSKSWSCEALR